MKILTQEQLNKLDGSDLLRFLNQSFQANWLAKKNERKSIENFQKLIIKTLQDNFPDLHKKEGLKKIKNI